MTSRMQWYPIQGRIPYEAMKRLTDQKILRLGIDGSLASRIINNSWHWQRIEKVLLTFWNLIGVLIVLGSIYLSFTWNWWTFIPGLWIQNIIWRGNQKTAGDFVVQQALIDPLLYESVSDLGGWLYLATVPQDVFNEQHLNG